MPHESVAKARRVLPPFAPARLHGMTSMRVERKGGPPDLQAAFTKFVRTSLLGRVLDDEFASEATEGKFPDFECLSGLLLMEMKHLEADQHDRLNEVIHAKTDP